jgi:hypothetical protein
MFAPFIGVQTYRKLAWSFVTDEFLLDYEDPIDDVPPACGQHLIYEIQGRNDQLGSPPEVNFRNFVNGDTTPGNYHFQRYVAKDAVAAATEATFAHGAQVVGDSATAGFRSSLFIIYPNFRNGRQKVCHGIWSIDDGAASQIICHYVQKRQIAGVGSLLDPITSVRFDNALGNWTRFTIHRAVTP